MVWAVVTIDKHLAVIIRYMPEKQLKEQKLKIHVDIFKKLHEKLTLGGEGNILNQIKV